ncbi:MAG TPA: response regulator transcription factor [Rubneribacter badeniensis]|uniref:Response regulator transcription factor n=1 Tax=Rubneribacter badeniensis TaxID=2070688 RepID=A0A9D2VHX0_9ACTN|nr:response regulator transcription factor [Rubneribacter badeniensis]
MLVVEDDAAISDVTCSFLAQEGYACTPVFSGTEARLVLGAHRFDLVICDLMLPGLPGEDVVALVRAQGATPVIVTSAKGTTSDKVALLRTGADDYLVKPFDLDELLARVEVQLRRVRDVRLAPDAAAGTAPASGLAAPRSERTLRFRAWIADEDTRTFTVDGAPVRLTRTEFDLVCALMRRPRKVFTKRELFAAAWREEPVVEEKTVNTHIGNIRAKLKGTGTEGYIETVWGIGFKLAE